MGSKLLLLCFMRNICSQLSTTCPQFNKKTADSRETILQRFRINCGSIFFSMYLSYKSSFIENGERFTWISWCPHPESNQDHRLRTPMFYPIELWGQKNVSRESHSGFTWNFWVYLFGICSYMWYTWIRIPKRILVEYKEPNHLGQLLWTHFSLHSPYLSLYS